MISGEQWDTREGVIHNDLRNQDYYPDEARVIARQECTEQFGPRPEETKP